MGKRVLVFLAVLLLFLVLVGATDEDSLLNDADAVVDSGVNFDIPAEATDWPDGREKHFCGCPFDEDTYCSEQPITYLIKVQNWGSDLPEPIKDIVVVDDLPAEVDYIPGTTEMASQFDENGAPISWTTIPDSPGGVFPLSGEGYKVADTLAECDQATWICTDTRALRFKVMPKTELRKDTIIENTAIIKDTQGVYYTNYNVPLSLAGGNCLPSSECEQDATLVKWCGGSCLGCTDDDTIAGTDEDSLLNDADAVVDSGVNFDIPPEATDWIEAREKEGCTCRSEWADHDTWCDERPMYYLIKVQNWGNETAHEVMVIDDLEAYVTYSPSTTEMATQFDENGDGIDWAAIPDGPNGEFPLGGAGYKVADTLVPCNIETLTCADTRLIRFKVVPKSGLAVYTVIPNQATIKEATVGYLTNSGTPLKLKNSWNSSDCRYPAECPEPSKSECGGGGPDVDSMSDADVAVADTEVPTDADTVAIPTKGPSDDGCGCSVVW
ncbi:MAG TPA: hypothetical protein P5077_04405 [bacterium]|nr:hypothetical protein [bacterium]